MEYGEEIRLEWNRDMHYALDFSKLWCKVLGIWPWQHNETFSIIRSGFFIIIQIVASSFFLEGLFMYSNCGLTTDLIDALTGLTVLIVTAMKIFLPRLKYEQMRHIIQSSIEDWSNICEPDSRQIMNKYSFWGRLVFIVQIGIAFIVMLEMTIARPPNSIVDASKNGSLMSERNILLGPSCWISATMPSSLYLMHYYSLFISLWTTAFIYPGCDAFMFNAALHICGQFEILNMSMEKITNEDGYLNQRHRLRKYSKRHDKLLILGNQLNDIVNLIILAELLSNSFLICISGIAILSNIKSENVSHHDINLAIRIYIWYVGLFMYTHVGEQLSHQAEKCHIAMYSCPWYNMPPYLAKNINFMIMRNHSFCYLTAGGVLIMNYEAFKEFTRLIFSYFSVLKLMILE